MKRRQFITLIGGAAAAWPLAARAQRSPIPVVGVLNSGAPGPFARMMVAFNQGLADMGYAEGRNVRTEVRWANGEYGKLPELALELARRPVDVLAAPGGDVAAAAATAATATIPIVFMVGRDPVKAGFVTGLNRPGGNATGVNILTSELAAKRLELLRELVPRSKAGDIGVLINPTNPNATTDTQDLQEAAAFLGQRLAFLQASTDDAIATAFATFAEQKVAAVLVNTDPFYLNRREQLAALAARHALPAIYSLREHILAGGLVSYGANLIEAYRLLGIFVGRVLRGAKPAEMPVEQPTKYELTINLKTAQALGLEVPPTLLARADEVIE
jgi:putative ABC transport system substrate-binding protein